jgi:hypothetical protein
VIDHEAVARAAMAGRPRDVFDGAEADRATVGEGVAGGDDEQHGLAEQVLAVDVAVARDGDHVVVAADDEVDGAGSQRVEGGGCLAVEDLDAKVGCGFGEEHERAGEQGERGRLDEGQSQATARRAAQRGELGAHGLVGAERLIGVLDEAPPFSLVVGVAPPALALAAAIPALAMGPRLLSDGSPQRAGGAGPSTLTATAAGAAAVLVLVAGSVTTAALAGPVAAGVVSAVPLQSTAFALLMARHRSRRAAVAALRGMTLGLPGYLAFCLTLSLLAAPIGALGAAPVALSAAVLTAAATWRLVGTS